MFYQKKYYLDDLTYNTTFVAFGRSLTYIRNNKGPSIDPCETPYVILSKVVHLFPFCGYQGSSQTILGCFL